MLGSSEYRGLEIDENEEEKRNLCQLNPNELLAQLGYYYTWCVEILSAKEENDQVWSPLYDYIQGNDKEKIGLGGTGEIQGSVSAESSQAERAPVEVPFANAINDKDLDLISARGMKDVLYVCYNAVFQTKEVPSPESEAVSRVFDVAVTKGLLKLMDIEEKAGSFYDMLSSPEGPVPNAAKIIEEKQTLLRDIQSYIADAYKLFKVLQGVSKAAEATAWRVKYRSLQDLIEDEGFGELSLLAGIPKKDLAAEMKKLESKYPVTDSAAGTFFTKVKDRLSKGKGKGPTHEDETRG